MGRKLFLAAMVVLALGVASSAGAGPTGRIPGARGVPSCAAAGPYWPTMTLALVGNSAWIACKEQSRLIRLALPGGRRTASRRLDGQVTAVAVGLGSLWALDTGSTLYRLDPKTGKVVRRIQTGASAAYNIWIGGGSVWVADDRGGTVLRISPATNRVIARIPVGDGPADMVFSGSRAWVVTHRDNTIYGIDLGRNRAQRLATIEDANAAAERFALLAGSLWVTGRGVQLVELDPATGEVRRTLGIGGTGIDVVAAGGALWIPVRTAAVDRSGFPTMTAVQRVQPDGAVTTVASAVGRVDLHGLAAGLGAVWLSDNTNGVLYRLPT